MRPADYDAPLTVAAGAARDYLAGVPDARVAAATYDAQRLRAALDRPLPDGPTDPATVVRDLAADVADGLVAMQSGRYFGWVIGGSLPAAVAADWLVSAWDQNSGMYVIAPGEAVVEEVAGRWLLDLLGLPAHASFGFVTGGQGANTTALAVARHAVLRSVGWDVEADGLQGAPRVRVLVGEERHSTVDRALRLLGFGASTAEVVPADGQGRMDPQALRAVLRATPGTAPTIVVAQAGNVNTGSVDPLRAVGEAAREAGAWLHVDGAIGLWVAASPTLRPLLDGYDLADSWAADAHKLLNVPYDCGLVVTAHPAEHRAALGMTASYLQPAVGGERDQVDYGPEASRRGRGFPVYAALRSLGRSGVADMVEGCCAMARLFGELLAAEPDVEVLCEITLNQVLVRFRDGVDDDAHTRAVVAAVQEDGTCWVSGTTWHGVAAMRISVANWRTDEADVRRSVAAMLRCRDGLR